MSTLLPDLVTVAHAGAIATSVLLGLLIGAFYGYELVHTDVPPRYPFHLWAVGIAFVAVLAIVSVLSGKPPTLGASIGRGLLWTFTCGSIPVGRLSRGLAELRWLRHKTRRLSQ